MSTITKSLSNVRRINAIIVVALATYFLVGPFLICATFLRDPRMNSGEVPNAAYWLHARLTPAYGAWARERVASGRAAKLKAEQFMATEWPMFGTVFYLWATESLQEAWEKDPKHTGEAPKVYAKETLAACADLIADPGHAAWVKVHWGDSYLTHQNAFYRLMLIGGLATYQKLSGDAKYEETVRAQVDSLVAELDATPSGLLDDYPGECYPGDVMAGVYAIREADAILGTDPSAFVTRMRRAFTGRAETSLGLPPFWAVAQSGAPIEPTRGSANSYMCLTAPDLWQEDARRWYGLHDKYFWQESTMLAGFREYPRGGERHEWEFDDMDSGPVALGYGFAATAFGTGAALRNGDLHHGAMLLGEMLPGSWPLPNGTLLLPRMLSDTTDAPYLGEACVLYNMTRTPAAGVTIRPARQKLLGGWPGLTYLLLALYGGIGLAAIVAAVRQFRRRAPEFSAYPYPTVQLEIWALLVLAGMLLLFVNVKFGLLALVLAQFLPRTYSRGGASNASLF